MAEPQFRFKKLDQNSPCLLCGKGKRVESHIIPRFVIRGMIETSATGFYRSSLAPNIRQQGGGPSDYLLCQHCEALFSRWENEFARKLFRPTLKNG